MRAHPQVLPLLEGPELEPPFDIEQAREGYRLLTEQRAGPPEPVARARDVDAGGVPARLYIPGEARQEADDGPGMTPGRDTLDPPTPDGAPPVIVYFHGGGWVVGDLAGVDPLCRALANRTGAAVLSVDYRLAPEHRFPAPLEDAEAALAWIAEGGARLGVDGGRLAVAGDSAGATIAAALARRARDAGGPPLRAQLLAYPPLDAALATGSMRDLSRGWSLTRDQMRWYWEQYAPGAAARSPDASPLRAADLRGLPPALVVLAELDPLRDDGLDYVQRLEQAGVEAAARVWPGMVHGFLRLRGMLDDAHAALDEAAEWLAPRLRHDHGRSQPK